MISEGKKSRISATRGDAHVVEEKRRGSKGVKNLLEILVRNLFRKKGGERRNRCSKIGAEKLPKLAGSSVTNGNSKKGRRNSKEEIRSRNHVKTSPGAAGNRKVGTSPKSLPSATAPKDKENQGSSQKKKQRSRPLKIKGL